MPLPVANDHSLDVLEGREPHARPEWHVTWLLVGGALAVALLAGVVFVAARDDTAAVVDASGSLVLDDQVSRLETVPHSTQVEGRDAVWTGSIQVELPDRQLVGDVVQHFSWAATVEDDVVMISHSWGRLDVTFGATRCSGPFAKSAYREPRETGGALSLRCDDGSLFTATMLLERDEEATVDHPLRVFYTLEDGAYVAG
jgi:hypothetical protein